MFSAHIQHKTASNICHQIVYIDFILIPKPISYLFIIYFDNSPSYPEVNYQPNGLVFNEKKSQAAKLRWKISFMHHIYSQTFSYNSHGCLTSLEHSCFSRAMQYSWGFHNYLNDLWIWVLQHYSYGGRDIRLMRIVNGIFPVVYTCHSTLIDLFLFSFVCSGPLWFE